MTPKTDIEILPCSEGVNFKTQLSLGEGEPLSWAKAFVSIQIKKKNEHILLDVPAPLSLTPIAVRWSGAALTSCGKAVLFTE